MVDRSWCTNQWGLETNLQLGFVQSLQEIGEIGSQGLLDDQEDDARGGCLEWAAWWHADSSRFPHKGPAWWGWTLLHITSASIDRIVEVNGQAGLGKDMVTQQQRQGIPKSMGPCGFTKIIWDVGG